MLGAWNRRPGPGIEPETHKKLCCMAGVRTLDLQNITIVWIATYDRTRSRCQRNEITISTWMASIGRRRTDRPFEFSELFSEYSQIPKNQMHVAPNSSCCTKICTTESWIQPHPIYKRHTVNMPNIHACVKTYQIWGIRSICLQVCTCGKHTTRIVYHVNYMIIVDFHFHSWIENNLHTHFKHLIFYKVTGHFYF